MSQGPQRIRHWLHEITRNVSPRMEHRCIHVYSGWLYATSGEVAGSVPWSPVFDRMLQHNGSYLWTPQVDELLGEPYERQPMETWKVADGLREYMDADPLAELEMRYEELPRGNLGYGATVALFGAHYQGMNVWKAWPDATEPAILQVSTARVGTVKRPLLVIQQGGAKSIVLPMGFP